MVGAANNAERLMTEVKLAGAYIPGFVKRASTSRNAMTWTKRFESSDVATVVFLATLVVIAVATYNDYWSLTMKACSITMVN